MSIKKKHVPGCSCCGGPPNCCSDSGEAIPATVTLTITGVDTHTYSVGFPACEGHCEDINGTWVLSQVPIGVNDCSWEYSDARTCYNTGSPFSIYFRVQYLGGVVYADVYHDIVAFGRSLIYMTASLSKPCSGWSSEALTRISSDQCTNGSGTISA